jgi:hypothetical protein
VLIQTRRTEKLRHGSLFSGGLSRMAPHPRTIAPGTDPVTQVVKRRTIRRRRRRQGAATGSMPAVTLTTNHNTTAASYEQIASRVVGICEGVAFANGLKTEQVFAGVKKSLDW